MNQVATVAAVLFSGDKESVENWTLLLLLLAALSCDWSVLGAGKWSLTRWRGIRGGPNGGDVWLEGDSYYAIFGVPFPLRGRGEGMDGCFSGRATDQ